MIQNYFILNRFILEANSLLNSAEIREIFSQEKSKLVAACRKDAREYYLEFSVLPGQSFINIRTGYSRAKKNTLNFFSAAEGEIIKQFSIANDDRIIKIECSYSQFFFTIRGKYTNVFFKDAANTFSAFKNADVDYLNEISNEFDSKKYIFSFNTEPLKFKKNNYLQELKKQYPIIGSELIKEAKLRTDDENKYPVIIKNILNEIENENPVLFIDEKNDDVKLGFSNFKIFPFTKTESYDDLITALNSYFSKKHFFKRRKEFITRINKHIERELNKLSDKLNNLSGRVEKECKDEDYKNIGNLLLVNLNNIHTGMSQVILTDINSGKELKIKLNDKLSPQKNAELYFEKAKAEKISYQKSKELLEVSKKEYDFLQSIKNGLNNIDDLNELNSIAKNLKIKIKMQPGKKEDFKIKFKHYIIDDKYNVYVGRDSKNNDLLTTKYAKQNDFWFHARSVSGSHVVLRVENTKEPVPKSVLKKAAALAAYHSKAKTAGVVPVAFTLKKYVVKKKGDPVGTVHLLKEDVLLVKPEIPKGCEFVTNE